VGCLATYRMALLVSKEEGTAKAASKIRAAAPSGWIKRGFYCEWCQTFWWGMATSLIFTLKGQIAWVDFVIYWFAFSAGGIIINQAFTRC